MPQKLQVREGRLLGTNSDRRAAVPRYVRWKDILHALAANRCPISRSALPMRQ